VQGRNGEEGNKREKRAAFMARTCRRLRYPAISLQPHLTQAINAQLNTTNQAMSKKRKHPSTLPSSFSSSRHPHSHKRQNATPQPHHRHQKPIPKSKSKPKPIAKQPPPPQKPPTLFCPSSRILLLGEGDFSFAASLVRHYRVRHLTATSLDSEAELLEKYPQASGNVAMVRGMAGGGGVVVHSVDAKAVGRVKAVRKRRGEVVPGPVEEGEGEGGGEDGKKGRGEEVGGSGVVGFDVVTFMFPHIGGKSTHLDRQVCGNQRTLSFYPPLPRCSLLN